MTSGVTTPPRHAASFRDPAGFLFEQEGVLHRAVHADALADVDQLFSTGLHDELVRDGLLVPHERLATFEGMPEGWTVLRPQRLPVISYACEWTDRQLQAAALLTLELQRRALRCGMTLKDASSFNVQFAGSRPVFIDLQSFTRLGADRAWLAYKQFCEHFLAPLALRVHVPGAVALAGPTLEGIPLGVASRLLPMATWFRPGLALHIHLHARSLGNAVGRPTRPRGAMPPAGAPAEFGLQLVASLDRAIRGVVPAAGPSAWSDYRRNNTYSAESADDKLRFVQQAVERAAPLRALDLGANDGHYARALAALGVPCSAVEVDAACAEQIHVASAGSPWAALLNTLRVDLTNPTPAHGWAHMERASFTERMRCDLVLALALLHHLSIPHHVPFESIADWLARLAPDAVVEYVPVDDPMVRQLLAARSGVTPAFLETLSERAFRAAFDRHFDCIERSEPVAGGRILHHFRRRS